MENTPKKRPVGTILILIYQAYGTLMVGFGLVLNLVLRMGIVSPSFLSPEQLNQIEQASIFWLIFGVVAVLVRLVGAIALVMLRKLGAWLLTADVAIQTISVVAVVLNAQNQSGTGRLIGFSTLLVYGIAVVICLYAWSLAKKGILR